MLENLVFSLFFIGRPPKKTFKKNEKMPFFDTLSLQEKIEIFFKEFFY